MFLGLDLGTSGLRACLVDSDGTTIAAHEARYDVDHPHSGWSEQNPDDWVSACEAVLDALHAEAPKAMSALRGIGLSGHMHGATLIDAAQKPLRPCILWNDTRAHQEARALDAIQEVRDLSGNIVFPGFTAPKLLWLKQNEPDLFDRVDKVLLPKDYLRLWLTGTVAADMSDAAGTSWLDVGKRDWSDRLLSLGQMRRDQMPDLVEGSEPAGTLRRALAKRWGISGTVTVVGGGGDNAVAACGIGAMSEGQGFVSLGTSGVLLAAKDRFAPAPETAVHPFCHAIPDTWYQMGVILSATDSLNWLTRITGQSARDLAAEVGDDLTTPGAVGFAPYLSGERTPYNDSHIRGGFTGIGVDTTRADLTRAVMEGVAFALRDNLHALEGTGTDLKNVLAIGGGAQSTYWVELLATVLNLPIDLPEAGDFGAALGAARLAMMGADGASASDVMTPPPVARTITPNTDLRGAYDDAYARFRALYPALKALK